MPNWKDIEIFGAAPIVPSHPSTDVPPPIQTPPTPAPSHSFVSRAEPVSLLSRVKAQTDLRFYKELQDVQIVDPEDYELDEIEGFYIGSREAWDLLEKYAYEVGYSCVTEEFSYFPGPGYYICDDEDCWYNVSDRIDEEKRILDIFRRADEEAAERPYHAGR